MFDSLTGVEGGLFDEFRRLQEEIDSLFDQRPTTTGIRSVARASFPLINVGAAPDQIEVYFFAAGLDPKALQLSIQQNVLTVAGTRELEEQSEQVAHYRRERFKGEFRRVVALPEDVDPERVQARYRDGVLQVTVKRKESTKPRTIELN